MTTPDHTLAARLAELGDGGGTKDPDLLIAYLWNAFYGGQLITTAEADARVKAAVLAEREACAEILDAKAADHDADAARFRGGSDPHHNRSFLAKTAREHAATIRSRGVMG